MASRGKEKGGKAVKGKMTVPDEDFSMDIDHGRMDGAMTDNSPPANTEQSGAPEDTWTALLESGMIDLGDGPPQQAQAAPAPSKAASVLEPRKRDAPAVDVAEVNAEPSNRVRQIEADPGEWLGGVFHAHLHTLNAIQVSDGLLGTHLHDLYWLHDRLVDHHETLVGTRNLVQKSLDGIARAVYMRGRRDWLRATEENAK